MRALVTGGAGFIGTNICKRLVAEGWDVVSIDNYSTGTVENHIDGVVYATADVERWTKEHEWVSTAWKFDVVYHMAALARIQPSFNHPLANFKTNAMGTFNMAQWCVEHDIPLIYAGSSSHHSGKFKNPYTFSKDIGEEIIHLYQKHYGLKASTTRFYNVYGPHQLETGAYQTIIGKWLRLYRRNQPLVIYGDGSKRRDFTHVDDIVDALVRIYERGAWGYVFELGRGVNYSINEICGMFNTDYEYAPDQPGEAQETLSDSSLAKEVLEWNPTINIEDYISANI